MAQRQSVLARPIRQKRRASVLAETPELPRLADMGAPYASGGSGAFDVGGLPAKAPKAQPLPNPNAMAEGLLVERGVEPMRQRPAPAVQAGSFDGEAERQKFQQWLDQQPSMRWMLWR
jgi:hypothetical protein